MTNHLFTFRYPDFELKPEPVTLPETQPRRHRFAYPMNVLMDKVALYYFGTYRTMDVPNILDLEDWLIIEAFRLVDLSDAYRIEIWYDPSIDKLTIQFLLAD